MVGAQGVQILHALQNVGEVAQSVFRLLGRGVTGPGEGAEGGHIGKIPLIVPPHIQGNGRTLGDDVRSQVGRRGDVQGGGKVVGAAGGQVAQGRLALQLHKAGDGLVQGAVAAVADHGVKIRPQVPGEAGGVTGALGLPHIHQIATCRQPGDGVIQRAQRLALPGPGIHDQQQSFHNHPPFCT